MPVCPSALVWNYHPLSRGIGIRFAVDYSSGFRGIYKYQSHMNFRDFFLIYLYKENNNKFIIITLNRS